MLNLYLEDYMLKYIKVYVLFFFTEFIRYYGNALVSQLLFNISNSDSIVLYIDS